MHVPNINKCICYVITYFLCNKLIFCWPPFPPHPKKKCKKNKQTTLKVAKTIIVVTVLNSKAEQDGTAAW